jgi:hypothetical protein
VDSGKNATRKEQLSRTLSAERATGRAELAYENERKLGGCVEQGNGSR